MLYQFVRIDFVPLISCGGCPSRELREGSVEIACPSVSIDILEKLAIFSENLMRLWNLNNGRNRQTAQFLQKSVHPHRSSGTIPVPSRIGDNRTGFVRKQRTAEVIE